VADQVVGEIKAAGGEAVADYNNVLDGEKIVQTAVEKWGRVDILVSLLDIEGCGWLRWRDC
jgi:hypothetical protein